MEEDGFGQLFIEAVREFGRAATRRETAQRAVECVAKRVSRFQWGRSPILYASLQRGNGRGGVDDALRLEFFCRVATPRIYAEVKKLGEALVSWEAFEEALWQAYNELPRSRNRCDFDQWVASAKTHCGAAKVFQEFGRRFARLPEREQWGRTKSCYSLGRLTKRNGRHRNRSRGR